jgi:hypothetical protein
MTIKEFEDIYEYCTREPHDFLCIDFTQCKNEQIKMGFSKVLTVNE